MGTWVMTGTLIGEVLAQLTAERKRLPVLNREKRVMLNPRMWHLIHERDGHECWMCLKKVAKGEGEIDHLMPRSFFPPEMVRDADRSWNLRLACVSCNQYKSNYEMPFLPRTFGVTPRCWDCHEKRDLNRPDPDEEFFIFLDWQEAQQECPELTVRAYCGSCGLTSWVPDERWVM